VVAVEAVVAGAVVVGVVVGVVVVAVVAVSVVVVVVVRPGSQTPHVRGQLARTESPMFTPALMKLTLHRALAPAHDASVATSKQPPRAVDRVVVDVVVTSGGQVPHVAGHASLTGVANRSVSQPKFETIVWHMNESAMPLHAGTVVIVRVVVVAVVVVGVVVLVEVTHVSQETGHTDDTISLLQVSVLIRTAQVESSATPLHSFVDEEVAVSVETVVVVVVAVVSVTVLVVRVLVVVMQASQATGHRTDTLV